MSILFITIPLALIFSLMAVLAFVGMMRSGQLDDLETPPRRMLFDVSPRSQNNPNQKESS